MSLESTQSGPMASPGQPAVTPITSLDDPRVIQILSTEHWSALTARSLAYNEAFVRAGMFLTFLSTSFIALALLAEAMTFGQDFLTVAAIVLAFDFVIGLTTFGRIAGANFDDLRALHGMARIRHGYVQVAPFLAPYFTTATHDDADSVSADYNAPEGAVASVMYGLTTSLGMIGLIVSMVGGVLICVLALLAGLSGASGVWIGLAGAVVVFLLLVGATLRQIARQQATLQVRFPAPREPRSGETPS
jgi:hypothetical protein